MSPKARWFCRFVRAVVFWCGLCLAAQTILYHVEATRPLSRFTSDQLELLSKLNHADCKYLPRLKSVIVPDRWDGDELLFSPMPRKVPELSGEKKAILVDLPAQVFGAFESGELVRWGPVSSGDQRHQTPSGSYHLNWRARVHVSTENPAWVLPWYFNFASQKGIGVHEYTLPGRPASHGCIRMLAVDAKWLFQWGEGWTLGETVREVLQPGTLILVLGNYDFASAQPWLKPKWWTRGVTLPVQQVATAK